MKSILFITLALLLLCIFYSLLEFILSLKRISRVVTFFLHCSIFKMLFQGVFSPSLLYHIFSFLSSTFFKFFQKLFSVILAFPLTLPPQVSLSIIPLSVAFVKPFFKISSKIFFSEFFLQLPSALFSLRPGLTYFLSLFFLDYRSRQLYHYITFFKVCQGNSFQDFHQKIGNISQ